MSVKPNKWGIIYNPKARGMERRGFIIHWLDATLPTNEKIERVKGFLNS